LFELRPPQAAGPSALDVTVINTAANPVPVTAQGTTNVAGTIGISGTPTVNVGNSPTVSLAGGTSVGISNSASAPVLVRDVDNPGRHPVTFTDSVSIADGSYAGFSTGAFTPPSGKRLVLEYVAGLVALQPGQKAWVKMLTPVGNGSYEHALTIVPQGNFSPLYAFPELFSINQQLRVYADGIGSVSVGLTRNANTGPATLNVTFSGFLLDQ
jgi:hypothetical protein